MVWVYMGDMSVCVLWVYWCMGVYVWINGSVGSVGVWVGLWSGMVCVCGFYWRCVGVWMVWAYGYMYSFGCVGCMGACVYVFRWVGGVGA